MMTFKVLIFVFTAIPSTVGLKYTHVRPSKNNAYVMMWISPKYVPKEHPKKLMTADEEEAELEKMKEEGQSNAALRHSLKRGDFSEEALPRNLHQTNVEDAAFNEAEWTGRGTQNIMRNANQLRRLGSIYPLVLITNDPRLLAIKNNATLQMQFPNLIVKGVANDEYLPHECKMAGGHSTHYQKLAVFGYTEFNKMLWLDADVSVKQNLDPLFDNYDLEDGNKVWGQYDNWMCEGGKRDKMFCTGMFLFKPSKEHVAGLQETARNMKKCWGDQTIIKKYFNQEDRKTSVFPRSVIQFQHCKDYQHSRGSMAHHDQISVEAWRKINNIDQGGWR